MISRVRTLTALAMALTTGACFRGKLPPREFYRLTEPRAASTTNFRGPAPLSGSIAVAKYETPGIYGSGSIVYRDGTSAYGAYPTREWALPLGTMLGTLTEGVIGRTALTSGRVAFDRPSAGRDDYVWRGFVREFDEVDGPTSVSTSVSLSAELVRVADDSVVWSGAAIETELVAESRSMSSVIDALSAAAARAVTKLAEDASATLRRLAAAGAQTR